MTSAPLVVHVWSDIACPWCFIGKRRFESALARLDTSVDVVVEHHSFELAPDIPEDYAGSSVDFLSHHKGLPVDRVEQMLAHVTELASAEGLRYDFAAVHHTRTVLAHQAVHHARVRGVQGALVERLFAAYFEEGRHLGRIDELASLAADVGLDPDEMRAVLEDGLYEQAVQDDIRVAADLGVTGVPFFVVDGRYGISGAQDSEVFLSTLQRALADRVDETL